MIKVYGKPNCPQCDNVKQMLGFNQLVYEYIDCTYDEDCMEYVKSKGIRSFPYVEYMGEYLGNKPMEVLKKYRSLV